MRTTSASLWAALALAAPTFAAVLKTNAEAAALVRQAADNQLLATEGKSTYDGVPLAQIPQNLEPQGRAALAPNAAKLNPNGWTATASSFQPGNEAQKAIDGDANTFWHTPWGNAGPNHPHTLIIDMKQNYLINTIAYQPRQDGNQNGNIGGHQIHVSLDGQNWGAPKVLGTWRDDASTKTSIFEASNARYVRLTTLTEAGGRGQWASVAEFSIYSTPNAAPGYGGVGGGSWSPTIDFPIVPVAAALLYNSGNVLTWSSYSADSFGGSPGGFTLTSTYFYGSQTVGQRRVQETNHDMFCPGINIDSRGRVLVTGGNNANRASLYTPGNDQWTPLPDMKKARGYQSSTTLSDGRSFVIGGSWSGGEGGKDGEVYSITYNTWYNRPKAAVQALLTNDAQGTYRADNHAMLFGWKGGWVFQAGPSKRMNWYDSNANDGNVAYAGNRADDGDAMCGIAVMYDATAGKILVTGGAPNYQNVDSTASAFVVTIGNPNTPSQAQRINPMWYKRIFHTGVVLPDGKVVIIGGQVYGQPFSDDTAQLQPEIWVPETTNFIKLPNINVARVYHSVAVLLQDGTVFAGGGGLCGGCATNHFDGQVYSPGYLFDGNGNKAARPVINSASGEIRPGQTLTATTNGAISKWSLVRLGSSTHTVNTDQRRIPLTATGGPGGYNIVVPNDYGILLPGYYWLFAINAAGVPSVGKTVFVPR